METALRKTILAIVTVNKEMVAGGGAPFFFVSSQEEQDKIATYLARITESVIHDLENGVYILVKH